jgi:predicted Zn-dependent protease
MRRFKLAPFVVIATVSIAGHARADDGKATILRAMTDELGRLAEMKVDPAAKPYWAAFQIVDEDRASAVAMMGATSVRRHVHRRSLATSLRIGDVKLDGGGQRGGGFEGGFPLDDDYDAMRRAMWRTADNAYKDARRMLDHKRAERAHQAPSADYVADFTNEAPATVSVDTAPPPIDPHALEALVKGLSLPGKDASFVQAAWATATASSGRRYFASTEGSRGVEPTSVVEVSVLFRAQADDGIFVSTMGSWTAAPGTMPSSDELTKESQRLVADLDALRKAPLGEDYSGPVLFEGRAAAQIVRSALEDNILGPSGDVYTGARADFAAKVGQPILPSGVEVVDDPKIDRYQGIALLGHYEMDDEGVIPSRAVVVQDGKLKGYLMSRLPQKGFAKSNGHARGFGASVGNLILSSKSSVPDAELKRRLIAEARRAGRSYGIIVRRLVDPMGMFDMSTGPFFSEPMDGGVLAFRVGLDGKEEPIRGVELGMIDVKALKNVVAIGTKPAVDNRADPVATSVVSPPLLIKDVELKHPTGSRPKPPTLPRP